MVVMAVLVVVVAVVQQRPHTLPGQREVGLLIKAIMAAQHLVEPSTLVVAVAVQAQLGQTAQRLVQVPAAVVVRV
jgi:hypothetical protein